MTVLTDDKFGFILFSGMFRNRQSSGDDKDSSSVDTESLEDIEAARFRREERRRRQVIQGKHSRHMRRVVHQARRFHGWYIAR